MPVEMSRQKAVMLSVHAEKTCMICGHTGPREGFKAKGQQGVGRYPACEGCYPQYRARFRGRDAEYQRKLRDRKTPAVDRERRTWLDVGPIRDWLNEHSERMIEDELAAFVGVHERVIFRIRYESQRVNLDTVDRMLVNAGRPDLLRDLYPALYAFDEDMEMAA